MAVTVDDNAFEYTATIVSPVDGSMTCCVATRKTEQEAPHFAIAIYDSPDDNGPSAVSKITPEQMPELFQKLFSGMWEAMGMAPPTFTS